jgi:plastocyanin
MHSRIIDLAVAAVAVGLTATALELVPSPAPADRAPRELLVTGSEFAFDAPDTVVAGATHIRFRATGKERHIVLVARVPGGRTGGAALAAMAGGGATFLDSLVFVGGPTLPGTSGESDVVVDLEPGEYVLLCPVSSPDDHKPHMAKGMARALTVVPPARGARADTRAETGAGPGVPTPDVRVALVDYGYDLSPMPAAGRRTFRVENRAEQPHEVLVVRLAPGKTVADVMQWVAGAPVGPPPAEPVGGVTSLTKGRVATFTATLTPGRYALLCYVPDARDHKPHVMHGMTREIEVR